MTKKRSRHKPISTQLYECRQPIGLSQAELARRVGISNVHLCQVEKGREIPSVELICRLLDEIRLEAEQLDMDETFMAGLKVELSYLLLE